MQPEQTATVVLSIDIGADGQGRRRTRANLGGSRRDAAAVEAVRQFVFEPAEVDNPPAR